MNIFQALRQDHDKQRQLLEALLETSGDTEERVHIFLALKDELISHAVAEERAFYKPLIMDDMTQEKSRHAIAEHHEIDELIEALEAEDRSSPAWLSTAKKLQAKVLHHLDDEEQEFFQVAGRVLEDKEKSGADAKACIRMLREPCQNDESNLGSIATQMTGIRKRLLAEGRQVPKGFSLTHEETKQLKKPDNFT